MAGPQDFRYLLQEISTERFFGVPASSKEASDYYDQISNLRNIAKLRGKLFLVYGMLDENVPFKHAAEIFDALIEAGKPFDSLVVPDDSHGITSDPYVVRRMMLYFGENLGGPEPQGAKR
jgi:dipeptidyl aminopeptidase/acylaminoacyl peptidase